MNEIVPVGWNGAATAAIREASMIMDEKYIT